MRELIELINTIDLDNKGNIYQDIIGRVYEYFLGQFAPIEGKGGEFDTPKSLVKLLVEITQPYKGFVYDPCCGSGSIFIKSEKFIEAHGGSANDISIYGQESNSNTWRLCKMNLAIAFSFEMRKQSLTQKGTGNTGAGNSKEEKTALNSSFAQ